MALRLLDLLYFTKEILKKKRMIILHNNHMRNVPSTISKVCDWLTKNDHQGANIKNLLQRVVRHPEAVQCIKGVQIGKERVEDELQWV